MKSVLALTVASLLVACSLALLAPGAVGAEDAAPTASPADATASDPISEASTAETDDAIERRLRQLFAAVEDLSGVRVRVAGGVATLSGAVATGELRSTAAALARRVEGVALVENEIVVEAGLRLAPIWERIEERGRAAVAFVPLLAIGVAVFAVFWFGSGWAVRTVRPLFGRARNPFVEELSAKTMRLAFVLAGALVALEIMDATAVLGSLLGAAGLAGLAIGFALRDTIENYVASILLSLRQPFAPNDLVTIDAIEGVVIRLTPRATVLMTLDGNHVRVPNATVFKGTITNFTRNPERRFEFLVGVGTETDLGKARAVALAALDRLDAVLKEPAPLVLVHELADWSVVLWIAGWVDQRSHDFLKTRSEAVRLVKTGFDAAGIEMPVPMSTVRTVSDETAMPPPSTPEAAPLVAHDVGLRAAMAADTAKDDALGRKAAADRSQAEASNLLRPGAPQE